MTSKIIRYTPSVIWMGVIFYLSHQPGTESANTSNQVLEIIFNILPLSTEHELFLHTVIRKLAHFSAYAILSLLIFLAYRGKNALLFTMMICFIFAISDEVHQLFIPGRSGEVRDVLIDMSGVMFSLMIIYFIRMIRSRRDLNV